MWRFNFFKRKEKSNPFYDALMEDWGKEDVYGPWTKEDPMDITCPQGNSDRQTLKYSPPGAEERQ